MHPLRWMAQPVGSQLSQYLLQSYKSLGLGCLYQASPKAHREENPRPASPIPSLPSKEKRWDLSVLVPLSNSLQGMLPLAGLRQYTPPSTSPQSSQDSRTMSRVREKEPYRYRTQSRGVCRFARIKVAASSSRGLWEPGRRGLKKRQMTHLEVEATQAFF